MQESLLPLTPERLVLRWQDRLQRMPAEEWRHCPSLWEKTRALLFSSLSPAGLDSALLHAA